MDDERFKNLGGVVAIGKDCGNVYETFMRPIINRKYYKKDTTMVLQ